MVDEADELHDRIVAARPDADTFAAGLLRARARAGLFGMAEPVNVGRYELRREVGRGGGGTVFIAWDAELAREVALKLILAADPELRQRALAEGQALAQLSHPNVVPVFDVGAIAERVYIVMELVRGVSLREYARTARPNAIVRAYRQCALGLAAAHAAKLVHRDFKPDNAVIANDGRVRVIDFGLALAGGDAGRAGPPGYMAPEQQRGDALTAAADQYALAVSLREALGRPTGRLGRVLARAAAEEPEARYPSIAVLEARLASFDPRVKWRRRGLVVVPLAIASIAYGVGQRREQLESPCARDDEGLADVWSPARRAALVSHFEAVDTEYGRLAVSRLDMLDQYAAGWLEKNHAACVAHQAGELSAPLYDQRRSCFVSARTQLSALAELATTVDARALVKLVAAIPELPDLASCAEEAVVVPPTLAQQARARALRARLDIARVHVQAGLEVSGELDALVVDAKALDYRPLVADVSLLLGTARLRGWQYEAAATPLHAAYLEQLQVNDYRDAVEAFARYAWVRSRLTLTPQRITDDIEAVSALAAGLPSTARFAQALLRNNLGGIAIAANDLTRAKADFETALVLAKDVTGAGAVELSAALSNLALVTDDPERQQALFTRRIAIETRALGADHAITLATQKTAALIIRDPVRAAEALRPPCRRLAALHPSSGYPLFECGMHLGWLALAAGDNDEARVQFESAAAVRPAILPKLVSAYLAIATGDRLGAAAKLRAWLANTPPLIGWSALFDAGQAELGLGLSGDPAAFARARDLFERALALHPRWSPIAWRIAWLDRR
ncbi:MAG: serine/threonine-protein kinase [Kofleriaceae bacterium]